MIVVVEERDNRAVLDNHDDLPRTARPATLSETLGTLRRAPARLQEYGRLKGMVNYDEACDET